jgi:hypothetical protein
MLLARNRPFNSHRKATTTNDDDDRQRELEMRLGFLANTGVFHLLAALMAWRGLVGCQILDGPQ